ncbi:hypothetical protein KDN34_12100 [Shewanella yunxiaonensis]|uniref:Uncharacterized protein n=1 Tax=Shewanella yunxiaonensis TaxID=2829809 RepID=A0ABX7YRE4_9GAMM|nr:MULTISPECIES: hypothetical protein [Shewanella]MDF0533771.1 hypothetical protein [Shewanella sp. A32]QUN04970.1 hypothetical protein KDN34_12100 [Shewanella yunxiaonensis]
MTATTKSPFPKRLLLLMLVYALLSLTCFIGGFAVMFAMLTIMMLMAIMARHKAGLWLLRGYAIFGLVSSSLLPYVLDLNPQLLQQLQQSRIWPYLANIPGWSIIAVLILLTMLQLWVVFTPKVGAVFERNINFNIMQ